MLRRLIISSYLAVTCATLAIGPGPGKAAEADGTSAYLSTDALTSLLAGAMVYTTGTPTHSYLTLWYNADGTVVAQAETSLTILAWGRWWTEGPDVACREFTARNDHRPPHTVRGPYCVRVRKSETGYVRYRLDGSRIADAWTVAR